MILLMGFCVLLSIIGSQAADRRVQVYVEGIECPYYSEGTESNACCSELEEIVQDLANRLRIVETALDSLQDYARESDAFTLLSPLCCITGS